MSYNWSIIDEDEGGNFTWNILPMFYEAMPGLLRVGNFRECCSEQPCSELLPHFVRGVADMERYPEKYLPMNPKNGWGSYATALEDLKAMRDAMLAHPDGKFVVR